MIFYLKATFGFSSFDNDKKVYFGVRTNQSCEDLSKLRKRIINLLVI